MVSTLPLHISPRTADGQLDRFTYLVACHNEQTQLDKCKRVQEQLRVHQVGILKHHVSKVLCCLHFLLLNHSVANTDNRFLHIFRHIDTLHQQVHIVLSEIQGIVSDPEVIKEALGNACEVYAEILFLLLLVVTEVHTVRIFVFCILLFCTGLREWSFEKAGDCECTIGSRQLLAWRELPRIRFHENIIEPKNIGLGLNFFLQTVPDIWVHKRILLLRLLHWAADLNEELEKFVLAWLFAEGHLGNHVG